MGYRMDDLHAPTVASGPTSHDARPGADKALSLKELMAQKETLEAELSALGSVLDSHGVNMRTSLTTFDGYPRSDIDVAQIRTTRARIIRLKTDHKILMAKLETAVHEQFAAVKASDRMELSETSSSTVRDETLASAQSAPVQPPFAKVNTVAVDSPADLAGLRTGDKIIRFGSADWTNHERLTKVAAVVQQNENRPIQVRLLRQSSATSTSQTLDLQLVPRRDWGGRGLLGCHLVPV